MNNLYKKKVKPVFKPMATFNKPKRESFKYTKLALSYAFCITYLWGMYLFYQYIFNVDNGLVSFIKNVAACYIN